MIRVSLSLRGALYAGLLIGCCAAPIGLTGCGDEDSTAPQLSINESHLKWSLIDGLFSINGRAISLPCSLDVISDAIGAAPQRRYEMVDDESAAIVTVHVWDDLGMFCFEAPNKKHITKVSAALGRIELGAKELNYDKFWPKSNYAGVLEVEGVNVTSATDVAELTATVDGLALERLKLFSHAWKANYASNLLTIIGGPKGAGIVGFSIGR